MTTVFPCIKVMPCVLRYGWSLPTLRPNATVAPPSTIQCMICLMGGFPTIRHNELRDLTATLLTQVCHNVATEPHLQPLSGESMSLHSAITTDNARVDIRANGFWTGAQDAYFDVREFHPNAPSNAGSISSAFKKHEDAKKELMVNVSEKLNMVFLNTLVFPSTGGLGQEATNRF